MRKKGETFLPSRVAHQTAINAPSTPIYVCCFYEPSGPNTEKVVHNKTE